MANAASPIRLSISTITAVGQEPVVTERIVYDAVGALNGWLDAMSRAGVGKPALVAALVSRALLETTDIDTIT